MSGAHNILAAFLKYVLLWHNKYLTVLSPIFT